MGPRHARCTRDWSGYGDTKTGAGVVVNTETPLLQDILSHGLIDIAIPSLSNSEALMATMVNITELHMCVRT